jgi:hypothetical protein
MSKFETDNVDIRSGAYDPLTKEGLPQPHQVKAKDSRHHKEQQGADVRGDFVPGCEPVLPEGLTRKRKEPLNPRTGRHEAD